MLHKKTFLSFGLFLLLTATVFFSTKLIKISFSKNFDFDSIRKKQNLEWTGPSEGETVNLNGFRTKEGDSFPQLPKHSLILLSIVDPKCKMCQASQDLIVQVQSEAKFNQIYSAVVSLSQPQNNKEYFDYADTLSKSDKTYLWEENKNTLSPALQKMVVPSHLLLNENGVILRRFPGGSSDKSIRIQMANQIISEMLLEKSKIQ